MMIQQSADKIKSFIRKYWIVLFILGTVIYFGSCIVVNFVIGKTWYNPDMCVDAMVAELMADEISLFPQDWTFSNQYFIVSAPVLGAVFNYFTENGFYAMALASSVMMVGIYLSYIWCLKPFVSHKTLFVGLFILSGGLIFGTSACDYVYGFQLFYTMSSYYASYVIGGFLTLGLFFRIYKSVHFHRVWFVIVGLLNFALGMQSLRQTLVFIMPMVIVAVYVCIIRKKKTKKIFWFSLGVLVCNVVGIIAIKILVKVLSVNTNKLINDLQLHSSIAELWEHLQEEINNLYKICGLYLWEYIKLEKVFVIVFVGTLFAILCVITAVVLILVRKDTSPLAIAVLWCFVSICLVFGVGVVLFSNRPIYYFAWYFLVGFSIGYLFSEWKKYKVLKAIFLMFILLVGLTNYYTNFYGDFFRHHDRNQFYQELTQEIADDNIRYVYLCDVWNTDASIYCYADGNIEVAACIFDDELGLLKSYPSPKHNTAYNKENLKNAYILFIGRQIDPIENSTDSKMKRFLEKLEFVREKKGNGKMERTVKIYKPKEDVFYRGND